MISKQLVKLSAILIIILFSTSINAQVDSTARNNGVNINFFNGYALAYKWGASESLKYRAYLGMNFNHEDGDRETESNSSNDNQPTKNNSEESVSVFTTELSFHFLFGLVNAEYMGLYFGIGPDLYYNSHSTDDTRNEANSERFYSSSENTFGLGLVSLVGIEGYLTNNITLFAETHLTGLKEWTSRESTNELVNDPNSFNSSYTSDWNGWNVKFQLVKVGFGVYF